MPVNRLRRLAPWLLLAVLASWALPYLYVWSTTPVDGCLRVDAWGPPVGFKHWNPERTGVWGGWFIWAFILAEAGIFAPYTWIPISLGRVLRGRRDIPFGLLVMMTGAFVFSCALTHLVVILTIFRPYYQLELVLLALCAAISNATAFVLHRKVKFLIGLPPLEAVLRANEVLLSRASTLQADKEALEAKERELQVALDGARRADAQKEEEIRKNAALLIELDRAREAAQQRAQRAEGDVDTISAEREELRRLNEELQRERAAGAVASERIGLQAAAIREIEVPVVPLWPGVLLLPMVGPMDSARAQRLTEALLGAVVAHSARVVILDLTGVRVVDTAVAEALSNTASAVKLIGSECVITGISAPIAMTVVKLGIDLGIETLRDVQQGLALAMRRVRHAGSST